MIFDKCSNCGKECKKHAKGMCTTCYKKLVWKPKIKNCPRCKRDLPLHAKGLCNGCYNSVYHLENAKYHNYRKYHNIDPLLYRQITKFCLICGFDKVVDLHHLDKNKKNNSERNMIGLCPNHHKMLHTLKYRDEIMNQIKEKLNNK
ncbi:hypothetical protein J4218_00295 [Candidatus Pacearchaeota archaeon]|nr:hypothetical protein [Candidatus Pacearchaeota archaeon]